MNLKLELTSLYKVGVKSLLTAIGLNASAVIEIKFLPLNIPVYLFLLVGVIVLKYSSILLISLFVSLIASSLKSISVILYFLVLSIITSSLGFIVVTLSSSKPNKDLFKSNLKVVSIPNF